jgi:hypothetical protein
LIYIQRFKIIGFKVQGLGEGNYLNLYRFYFLTGFTPVKSATLVFLWKNLTERAGFFGLFLIFSIPGLPRHSRLKRRRREEIEKVQSAFSGVQQSLDDHGPARFKLL